MKRKTSSDKRRQRKARGSIRSASALRTSVK